MAQTAPMAERSHPTLFRGCRRRISRPEIGNGSRTSRKPPPVATAAGSIGPGSAAASPITPSNEATTSHQRTRLNRTR